MLLVTLATKLGVTVEPMTPPSITVTDDAAAKLNEALSSAGEGVMLHLSINRFFEPALPVRTSLSC